MSWTYHQASGRLERNGMLVASGGYSGNGAARNNSAMQSTIGHGPIPVGSWRIGPIHTHPTKGPYVMNLDPLPGTVTFGRTLFRIHGDSRLHPGQASDGCIIFGPAVRQAIGSSADTLLVVVP
jgi:hypothetical protein